MTELKTIVRYKNRKLYDTQESCYIHSEDLLTLPRGTFQVLDHVTKNDITKKSIFSAFVTNASESEIDSVLEFLTK